MSAPKKLTPFDYLNSINMGKDNMMSSGLAEDEKQYNAFMICRGLSYFPDTVFYANEMNRYHHLDKKLQYDFLRLVVRKRKRFSKWMKATQSNKIDMIKKYYGYSDQRAIEVADLLDDDMMKVIEKKLYQGGKK